MVWVPRKVEKSIDRLLWPNFASFRSCSHDSNSRLSKRMAEASWTKFEPGRVPVQAGQAVQAVQAVQACPPARLHGCLPTVSSGTGWTLSQLPPKIRQMFFGWLPTPGRKKSLDVWDTTQTSVNVRISRGFYNNLYNNLQCKAMASYPCVAESYCNVYNQSNDKKNAGAWAILGINFDPTLCDFVQVSLRHEHAALWPLLESPASVLNSPSQSQSRRLVQNTKWTWY